MRKFLMAAAVLGVAACGEKTDGAMEDTTTVVPPPAVTTPDTTTIDTMPPASADSGTAAPEAH
jgi:hypothetical protein